MSRWAVVLAGGSGTRFWPLSTSRTPKQLLPLASAEPLLVETVRRLRGLVPPERVIVVTGATLVRATRPLLPELPEDNVLAEPRPASTGPALAWATAVSAMRDPDAAVLALHADWHVGDDAGFRAAAGRALDVSERHDLLVTVGIEPTRPDSSYGYIVPGPPLDGDARRVERFVEKPSPQRATELIAAGALWNSGLFAWTAARFFAETTAVAPELSPHMASLRAGDVAGFFHNVTPVAIDVSHFERSGRVAVVPGRFGWDDVGTWAALARVRPHDAGGNVVVGDAYAHASQGCVVWSQDGAVVIDGVEGLVVVRANGVTLVTTRERSQDLKSLLEKLPPSVRQPKTPGGDAQGDT